MNPTDKASLNAQLVKLGDMMGDGLHHEPDGKWIEREYKAVCRQLGIMPRRRSPDSDRINEHMEKRVAEVPCPACGGKLRQTRSGSMRAKCSSCGVRCQLMRIKRARTT